ncbi:MULTISPECIES: histidine triad nucleotide-binding protein [unclassified Rickettsia]|uniref:histidine triad nucleotide-binding protein n=1 Tax=unclassified Rickettsia TaxID=114295 RepID=UPI00209D215A|nr:histidine triad nucleotide-binding protein [Rickettsia endosymbiont of Ceutorhynchus assimilis]
MYDEKNIFAKIINKDIPAKIIYEDEKLLAFKDINPVAPVHLIVIPKQEYIDYDDFIAKASSEEIKYFFAKISDIAKEAGLNESGYRLVTNKGENVGQSIFHFHFHIIGGKKISGLIG